MKMMKLNTAKAIAADWHGGQWTALYKFASSSEVAAAQEPLCLAEIEENLVNSNTTPKQVQRLQQLKAYIEYVNRKV